MYLYDDIMLQLYYENLPEQFYYGLSCGHDENNKGD